MASNVRVNRSAEMQMRGAWLFVVVLFALGSAGLVTAMGHRPGTDTRDELTWSNDKAVRPLLDAAVADIGRLADVYEDLTQHGRAAISALISGDGPALATAVDQGQRLVDDITTAVMRVRTQLRSIPGFGPAQERYFSADTIQRWNDVNFAIEQTTGVEAGWNALARGSREAVQLLFLQGQHDEYVAAAAQAGTQRRYAEAVRLLDLADPVVVQLRTLQGQLANRIDVALLDELLDRTTDLDLSLRTLYTLLILSDGKTTDEVKAALADVDAAREALPEDDRAISVVLADIAQSGPNEAVIRIEQSRGRLLEALRLLSQASPGASAATPEDAEGSAEPGAPGRSGNPPSAGPSGS